MPLLKNSFSALSEVSLEELVVEKIPQGEQRRQRSSQQEQAIPKWLKDERQVEKKPRKAQRQPPPETIPPVQREGCGPCWAFKNDPKKGVSFCSTFSCNRKECRKTEAEAAEKVARAPAASPGGWLCTVDAEANTAHFRAEGERIRMACMAERLATEAGGGSHARELVTDKPLLATTAGSDGAGWTVGGYSVNAAGKTQDGWQLLSMAIDSGAAETVIPHRLVNQHPLKETDASRGGLCYSSATGQPIPNLGEQCLPLVTMEETFRGMTFQAAPVSKPLGSVKRICAAGHRVVFDEDGSFIQNKATGEINMMREDNGNYMLDMWIVPPQTSEWGPPSFGRQR